MEKIKGVTTARAKNELQIIWSINFEILPITPQMLAGQKFLRNANLTFWPLVLEFAP